MDGVEVTTMPFLSTIKYRCARCSAAVIYTGLPDYDTLPDFPIWFTRPGNRHTKDVLCKVCAADFEKWFRAVPTRQDQ